MLSIDVESTGTDPVHDRIFQIGLATELDQTRVWINPEREIPAEVVELCRLTPEHLDLIRRSPTFAQAVDLFAPMFDAPVWIGYGVARFDLAIIAEEFARCGRVLPWEGKAIVDFESLYKIMRPRRLANFAKEYGDIDLTDAHDALVDAEAVLNSQHGFLTQHPELKALSPRELAVMSNYGRGIADPAGKLAINEQGVVVFNTHRNRGVPVVDDISYANWLNNQAWVPVSTKQVIDRVIAEEERKSAARHAQPGLFDEPDVEREIPF